MAFGRFKVIDSSILTAVIAAISFVIGRYSVNSLDSSATPIATPSLITSADQLSNAQKTTLQELALVVVHSARQMQELDKMFENDDYVSPDLIEESKQTYIRARSALACYIVENFKVTGHNKFDFVDSSRFEFTDTAIEDCLNAALAQALKREAEDKLNAKNGASGAARNNAPAKGK